MFASSGAQNSEQDFSTVEKLHYRQFICETLDIDLQSSLRSFLFKLKDCDLFQQPSLTLVCPGELIRS